jgi:hypothetical protein
MSFAAIAIAGSLTLFVGMLVLLGLGHRLGRRDLPRATAEKQTGPEGLGAIDAALLGLLSLVLAFTFSSAASRFDTRRDLVVDETNAIATAYLRIDLLPADAQPTLRADFKQYVDARLAAYDRFPDVKAAFRELDRGKQLQQKIWRDAMAALHEPSATAPAAMLVTQALNAMIDLGTTQIMAAKKHPPLVIFAMLAILALVGATVIGYGTAALSRRWWLHALAFAILFAVTFFVILELEYPRLGLIRIANFDSELRALRQTMP